MNKEEVQVDYENEEENITAPNEEKQPVEEDIPTTIYIDGFIRPFQVDEVKALVSEVVQPIDLEENFFLAGNKSYCYVRYKSQQDAKKAMENLNGRQFPLKFGNRLHVRITTVTPSSMQEKRTARSNEQKSDEKRVKETIQRPRPERVSIDSIFRKTAAKPIIFYKPLSEKQVELKKAKMN